MDRIILAKFGEDNAEKLLLQKGYQIIRKNFRCRIGEIDIIALDKNILVFVEVKCRYDFDITKPEDSITKFKINKIGKVGELFKLQNPQLSDLLRIDAILIEVNNKNQIKRLEHIKNCSG